jgi:hypothetical protein
MFPVGVIVLVKKWFAPLINPPGIENRIMSLVVKLLNELVKFHVMVFPAMLYPGVLIDAVLTVTPAGKVNVSVNGPGEEGP